MADHCHIFWCCPVIHPYWLVTVKEINSIVGFDIEYNFQTVYLCNLPADPNSQDKYLLKISLTASKKSITRKWLNGATDGGRVVSHCKEKHEMETFSLRLDHNKAQKYWLKWLLYVNEKTKSGSSFLFHCVYPLHCD